MTPWQSLDWDVRVRVPTFLRAAGFGEHADALASLPEIASLRILASVKATTHAAAQAAIGAWRDRKPPNGSHACTAARQTSAEATGMTLLPSAGLTIPIARELQIADAALREDAKFASNEAERAAEWSACVAASDAIRDLDPDASETWTRARAKLHPIVAEIMKSWKG